MSPLTMQHGAAGAAIFTKRKAALPTQYRMIAEIWCQSANIRF